MTSSTCGSLRRIAGILDDPPLVKRESHVPRRCHSSQPYRLKAVAIGEGQRRSQREDLKIMRKNLVGILPVAMMGCLILPTLAFAQGGIAGVVTDSSGGVLPGVTVKLRALC